jgi:hypothetical protein
MKKNLSSKILSEVKEIFDPLLLSTTSIEKFIEFTDSIGWNVNQICGDSTEEILISLGKIPQTLNRLKIEKIESWEDALDLISKGKLIFEFLNDLEEITVPNPSIFKDFLEDLVNKLVIVHLSKKYPKVFAILQFIGVIYYSQSDQLIDGQSINKNSGIPKINITKVLDFINDPITFLKNSYCPFGLHDRSETNTVSILLFEQLSKLLVESDIYHTITKSRTSLFDSLAQDSNGYIQFNLKVPLVNEDSSVAEVKLSSQLESVPEGGPLLGISIEGNLNVTEQFGEWLFYMTSTLESPILKISPDSIEIDSGQVEDNFELNMSLIPIEDVELVFGSNEQSRFEIKNSSVHCQFYAINNTYYWKAALDLNTFLLLSGANGDSLFNKIVGADGLKVDLDLQLGYDSRTGFFFGSHLNAGFKRTFEINKTFFDFFTIERIRAGFVLDDELMGLSTTGDVKIKFGKAITFRIDDIGLKTGITFGEGIKNLGIGDFDFSFKKPNGIGVSLDFGNGMGGSGYLYLGDHMYYGFLSLKLKKFNLDLIGILNTQMPDGSDGYSFLALVAMDLPKAIPLVWGFYLQKVGGIVGLHRDMNPDALREGMKTGALDQVLFPENIAENINSIITNLNAFFPIKKDRHSFAIMADLTYGDSEMIHVELGVMVSVPSPVIIAIGGTVKVKLPVETGDKLRLNCAFLGILDFGRSLMSFDARLYDSVIAGSIYIEGDMAARFGWGSNKMFMLSVGGFHPQFVPDPTWGVGTLKRLAVRFSDTAKLKIFAEGYFAVTSNTFQTGARAEVRYNSGKLKAEAYAGFDALLYFSPFHFTVNLYAGADISYDGHTLFGASLELMLTGPGQWNARGSATLEILCFDVEVGFDVSWGSSNEQGLPAINVLDRLKEEILKETSWKSTNPQDGQVVYRPKEQIGNQNTSQLVLSPNGKLQMQQLVVPLNFTMSKFGENPIAGANRCDITVFKVGTSPVANPLVLQDYFAPAQYKGMGDQQKLKALSYELMDSGVEISGSEFGVAIPVHATYKTAEYENVYKEGVHEPDQINFGLLGRLDFASGGALGKHEGFRSNKRKQKMRTKVKVMETPYAIVFNKDICKNQAIPSVRSKAMAEEKLAEYLSANPEQENHVRVAPRFEYRDFVPPIIHDPIDAVK